MPSLSLRRPIILQGQGPGGLSGASPEWFVASTGGGRRSTHFWVGGVLRAKCPAMESSLREIAGGTEFGQPSGREYRYLSRIDAIACNGLQGLMEGGRLRLSWVFRWFLAGLGPHS